MDNIKDLFELFRSKSQAGKDFEDKHVVHTRDDANGNGDEVFKGSKVKPVDRKKTRLGYNPDEDHKVYESKAPTIKDGYYVTNSHGKVTHNGPFKDSNYAVRHADKEEDRTGRIHTVHHVKGGKIAKQWQFSDSAQRYHPYTDHKGEEAHYHITEDLSENYTIKSMGHENVHLLYKGKLVKKFSDPREAKMYLAKMQKNQVEEEVELSERNKENKLKKDIFTVKKGQAEVAKGINFARYQPTRIADLKGDDHRIVHPDNDEEFTKYAGRKTALRTYKLAGRNAMKNEALTEDDIIDAIEEMAAIEGIELTEEVFNELYEALVSELNESKPVSVRESFIKKYVQPELVPNEQRIQEELSYLPEAQLNLLLDLYENLDEQNKAIFRKNLGNPEMINNFVDFALTNGD